MFVSSRSGSWMEVNSHRNSSRFLQMHPRIEPRMRSILLDWMMEVSEAFTLQRHTFYLAQDYFDRFMQRQYNVQKESLQVIGATCLFLASKMEESRAVKLKQVVDVGDGAYTEQDVRRVELLILKTLGWRLSSDTALFWLELYLQLVLMEVLDLCMLHVNSMDFEYNVLAAAILSRFFHQEVVEQVSGLSGGDIEACISWVIPFVSAACLFGEETVPKFVKIHPEEGHNIQTHTDYLTMLHSGHLSSIPYNAIHTITVLDQPYLQLHI
uniref:G2/mitotic-specific cyclin-B2 n=1 Tax=Sphaeramia orbicularis TaxID=375764 RepID=A0A673B1N7_9TELE